MKLKELVKVIPADADVTFEIVEETYPVGILVKDILVRYPLAEDYEVLLVEPAISTHSFDDIPTICIEVSNGKQEEPK